MPELKDLFDRAVATPPAEPHPASAIVRAAQRDRARRTTAVVVAAVAAAVVAVVGLGHGLSQRVAPAPVPAPAYQPPAGAVPLDEAVPAEPRVDYFDELTVRSDAGTSRRFVGHSNDGRSLLMRVDDDGGYTFSVVGGGEPADVLAPPPGQVAGPTMAPLAVDGDRQVWGDRSARELELWARNGGDWFEMSGSLADLPAGASIEDAFLWDLDLLRVIASDPGARRAMVYSARLRPGATLEPELPEEAVAAGHGSGVLLWVPVDRPDVVEVLDTAGLDDPVTIPLDLAPGCEVAPRRSLGAGPVLAVWVQCDRGRAGEVHTFDVDGRPGQVLVGPGVRLLDATASALVVVTDEALHLLRAEDRLVRIEGRTATDGVDAAGGAVTWSEAPDGTGPSHVYAVP